MSKIKLEHENILNMFMPMKRNEGTVPNEDDATELSFRVLEQCR
jgi:hypothetical protein